MPILERLDLSCNKIIDLSSLSNIKTLECLKYLDLSNNLIDWLFGLEAVSKSLEHLNLAENKLVKMENLECLKSLKILNLRNNLISTIENLGSIPLEELDLTNNRISKIGQNINIPALKKLNV